MKRPIRYDRKYVPSLDGLRALAVFIVITYHLNFSWAKGGFIGVDIFFVLSGYLITHILLLEWNKKNTLHLRDFWNRRFRRLIPAVYIMVIAVTLFSVLFNHDLLRILRGEAFAAFLYISNWWYIFYDISYFDSFHLPSPFKNLWTLAIEEQFYLIWPFLLYFYLRWIKNPLLLIQIICTVILASVVWMGILYTPGHDPSRVYYGTDTRLFALLIGCVLAFIWPFSRLNPKISLKNKAYLNLFGLLSLVCLLLFVFFINEYQTFWYRGGLFIVAILSAITIAVTAHPSSFLNKLFILPPLRWIGKRSYGIYLWHYPIIILSTPLAEAARPHIFRAIFQVIITFMIADLSFRYIETPILQNGFINYIKSFLHRRYFNFRGHPVGKWLAFGSVLFAMFLFCLSMMGIFSSESTNKNTKKEIKIQANFKKEKNQEQKEKKNSNPKINHLPPKKEIKLQIDYKQVLAIGDSVLIDIAPYLKAAIPHLTIDGKVGRQLTEAISLSSSYQKKFNTADSAVILELGTNGSFTKKQLNQLINQFDKASIYLINVRVPRRWEELVNDLLKNTNKHKNVTVIDWYTKAINKDSYFARDGVHLTKRGSKAYVKLLTETMKKN